MGRWLLIGFAALVVAIGIGAYVADDKDWGPNREAQVVTAQSGETIVIERDRHFFPFPFLFVPLFIFGLFWFLGGRRRWEGGGPGGGNPDWLRDWHERQHRETDSRMGPPPGAQSS